MFYRGQEYKDKQGEVHTVLMHNWKGKFPVITKDSHGRMAKFTHEGRFYEHIESDKDLISG